MRGFSLVELSIVLVILGLLVGGVLSGQSLIRASELRAVGGEYQRYITVTRTFYDKYFALPGDMANATSFWGKDDAKCSANSGTAATPGTCNGDGSGTIDNAAAANATGELFRYWQQLALAGLIEGVYSGVNGPGSGATFDAQIGTNVPASKLNNAGWTVRWLGTNDGAGAFYYARTYNHVLFFGRETGSGETADDVLKPEEAWNIDVKLDDGKPQHGKISSFKRSNTYTGSCVSAAGEYDVSLRSVECSLLFSNDF